MSAAQHIIAVVVVLTTLLGVDGSNGYYLYIVDQCPFSSWDLKDLEYIQSHWYNKAELLRFNSTVGKFVGYTPFGVFQAEYINNQTAYMAQMKGEKERYCRSNVQSDINNILTKKVEPIVKLRLGKASSGGHPAMLVCSAYSFYPKMIKLTWNRDDQEVTGDVVSSEELADGDWYYQIHSHLQFTPKSGEKISCVVEHASLKDPKELVWDSAMPEPERNKIAIGAAGLVLGLVVTAAGFIYYKTKARGRILVPNN
ncbi:boLa class II histocompatibility antigen, DQB*0101 beta chain-like [Sardina pilchardus]|uniref:boLa class II histocompatibility antigen, DQB*0101 beta chain-like n=1 Tax=Sardina pilchardus TaxID=27697 RepID=UPI002E10CE51